MKTVRSSGTPSPFGRGTAGCGCPPDARMGLLLHPVHDEFLGPVNGRRRPLGLDHQDVAVGQDVERARILQSGGERLDLQAGRRRSASRRPQPTLVPHASAAADIGGSAADRDVARSGGADRSARVRRRRWSAPRRLRGQETRRLHRRILRTARRRRGDRPSPSRSSRSPPGSAPPAPTGSGRSARPRCRRRGCGRRR